MEINDTFVVYTSVRSKFRYVTCYVDQDSLSILSSFLLTSGP